MDLIYCLSHIYSQLHGRWPGIPESEVLESMLLKEGIVSGIRPSEPSKHDWQNLIQYLCQEAQDLLPWLIGWCRKYDEDGRKLVDALTQHVRMVEDEGAGYVTMNRSGEYPMLLRYIPDPPLAISFTGDPCTFSLPAIAVIGSRKASGLAMQESQELGKLLARHGISVVSGGAFGCDLAAHFGCLDAQVLPAPTICVAASGLAQMYPIHNEYLFRKIRDQQGSFLSERLWWQTCRPKDFPARNRIISGLSLGVCVMQAAARSGALLTARHALNQGREVLVLRHPEFDIRAEGSRFLERDGAQVFSTAAEMALSIIGMIQCSEADAGPA